MNSLFSLDNPVWNFIGKLVDMVFLTILWALCSLPVVTLGASSTALYYVVLKLAEDKEGGIAASFFRAFRENFKQSTACWLIMLAFGLVLGLDIYICWIMRDNGLAKVLSIVFIVLAAVYFMILMYLFPLLARCDAGIRKIFMMAFVMSVKHFGWTLLMATLTVGIFAIGLFVQWVFLFISAGLAAYLNALILNKIFALYGLELEDVEEE